MKKFKIYSLLILAIACLAGAYWVYQSNVGHIVYNSAEMPRLPSKMEKAIEDIMSREDFKRQQELRAKEIYLTEEKAKIEAEYKAKIDDIEKQLEQIRGEKVSFQ